MTNPTYFSFWCNVYKQTSKLYFVFNRGKLLVNPSGRVSLNKKGCQQAGVNFFHQVPNRYTDFRLRSGPGILQFPSLQIRRSSGLQRDDRWAEDSG